MQIRLHLNRDLKEERARTLNLPGGEMCAWQGEKLLQQPWCKSPGKGACLTCSSFLKKEANLGRLVHKMKCEERRCQDAAETSSHKETLIRTMLCSSSTF